MKRHILIGVASIAILAATHPAPGHSQSRQDYKIYVDDHGVMRRTDTKQEVSYYGTNYTAPFAYAYRALGYLEKDRKEAIDRDIYHIARLGLNAFRLHLWDAELADSQGNLLANDHLDLLDYAIAEFEKRGIDIILTAQTNFGNGYPEKDIDTGAFTYDFAKCDIHDNPEAQKIQERYLSQLANHVNSYTGRSYAGDNHIIAIEINNEPCHSGTADEVTAYINCMAGALRKAGFDKPILYNVTHNPGVTEAYYNADIDGTTYQWYPTGLVSGHERKGNLLPAFDEYTIPWKDTMPNYDRLARVVYEFDPADVLYSHLYPAVARAFRQQGFQWITQFAYDPIDLAPFNTEYPTHFLNLAYTPGKAVSMMVAAEAAREIPRGADYGSYPGNSRFGHTRISYEEDLSEFNSPRKFIYSNNTSTRPVATDSLTLVAGVGSSPVVNYPGSGAYFLDRIDGTDTWRLEVMPDVTMIDDPFGDNSLKDAKVATTETPHAIKIALPSLGDSYYFQALSPAAAHPSGQASGGAFTVSPGIWLLSPSMEQLKKTANATDVIIAGNLGIKEYVSPSTPRLPFTLLAPRRDDTALDVAKIPEAYDFKIIRKQDAWYDEPVYMIESRPEKDGVIVLRRYVADKIDRIPPAYRPDRINVRFQHHSGDLTATPLPEGTELAVVTDDGFTYSAPITLDSDGVFSTDIPSLKPRTGYIMPTPYPSMVSRESPSTQKPLTSYRDIEFVELIIPQTADEGTSTNMYLPERIWIE